MTEHLTVRVAWHDDRWNGRVCRAPSANTFCLELDRIRLERNDAAQDRVAGRWFAELAPDQLPPCKAEGGAFMSEREWWRTAKHPYQEYEKTAKTHGRLRPTRICVPPFSTFAIPFNWMLRQSQEVIDEHSADSLPADIEPPIPSAWIFGSERQKAVSDLFFNRLTSEESLVFFYTKSGQPIDERISRLVVGCGRITSIAPMQWYDSTSEKSYPLWDRIFTHSIRPDGDDGLLLPYQDYLDPTGDPQEDARRRELLIDIAVVPEPSQVMAFSYAGELAGSDVALATLTKILDAVRRVREHGVSSGPWERREEWLNAQIARTWQDRGAFPGAGAALEAIGMRLGTALMLELRSSGQLGESDSPWPLLDGLLNGKIKPPRAAYAADLSAVRATWTSLSSDRRELLKLLSRFSLTADQTKRWFDPTERRRSTRSDVDDAAILSNPYRIVETDLGDAFEYPVSIGVVDRGVMPDANIAARHPLPASAVVASALDRRRARAAIVSVLRDAADEGDALLSHAEALVRLGRLDLQHPLVIGGDWLSGNAEFLSDEVKNIELIGGETDSRVSCLQLSDVTERERKLSSLLHKRAEKELPSLRENWGALLTAAIAGTGTKTDSSNPRHRDALREQADALERVTTRRLSVLVGRAGTGKTTVLGALLESNLLASDGVLFLAPTGKARVRITQKTNRTAMTVAQFLHRLGRYDGARQRPLFSGKEQYRKEKTVVIDECSMLTLDDLAAVLLALDLAHVQRIVLVGDPNQLPPIGIGRPFADLVAHLDNAALRGDSVAGALARLTVELRTAAGAPSDALRLASWYTREPQPVDADRVLSDLEMGGSFNDLSVVYWRTPADLTARLDEQLVRQFGLTDAHDVEGFNVQALGLTKEGWVPYDDHNGGDRFQILSPVRMHPYGVSEINRNVQRQFRKRQLQSSRNPWGLSLGNEEIVWGDKVILLRNGRRDGWNGKRKEVVDEYLANGEIGMAAGGSGAAKNKFLNVAFTGRPDVRFGFSKRDFSGDGGPLELAYALTVHKAQGSEFGTVFVILPRSCRPMSRELLYTALTRARAHLVLFVEGEDASFLYDLTRPEQSEVARRNSNLFAPGVRFEHAGVPFAEHLIHRTTRNELVRSKSELVIANHLHKVGLDYTYERPLDGSVAAGRLRPDFSFVDDAGDLVIWEHLGMLHRDDYRRAWEWKREWYRQNGFIENQNLFTTSEEDGLDMGVVGGVAERVRKAIGA